MYRLLQSTMNSVAYVREYGRSEDIPHLRRDFVGGRRGWSRRNCQGLSSSWNQRNSKCELRPSQRKSGCEVEKNEAGSSLEDSDDHEEGCSRRRRRENRGQWVRWRKSRDQSSQRRHHLQSSNVARWQCRAQDSWIILKLGNLSEEK